MGGTPQKRRIDPQPLLCQRKAPCQPWHSGRAILAGEDDIARPAPIDGSDTNASGGTGE